MAEGIPRTGPSPEELAAEVRAIQADPFIMNNLPEELPGGAIRRMASELSSGTRSDNPAWAGYWDRLLDTMVAIDEAIAANGIDVSAIEELQLARTDQDEHTRRGAFALLVQLVLPVYHDLRCAGYDEAELTGKSQKHPTVS